MEYGSESNVKPNQYEDADTDNLAKFYSPKEHDSMKLHPRNIIYITFDSSKGSEIKIRRSALVMSRNDYNLASNLVIVCPI